MKRFVACVIAAMVFAPSFAQARDRSKARGDAPTRSRFVDPADDEGTASKDGELPEAATQSITIPRHRYAYAASGVFLVGAAGLSWWANGQATRADSIASAHESRRVLQEAHDASAGANLLYALAGVSLVYGVVLEFLPDDVADKADLTFHF